MIDAVDKKKMFDSVITGKENASKDWNCVISVAYAENFHGGFIQRQMVSFVFGVRCLWRHNLTS